MESVNGGHVEFTAALAFSIAGLIVAGGWFAFKLFNAFASRRSESGANRTGAEEHDPAELLVDSFQDPITVEEIKKPDEMAAWTSGKIQTKADLALFRMRHGNRFN